MSKYWFKRKRYGWGWVPSTWQGWLLIAIYVIVVVAATQTIQDVPAGTMRRELGFYLLIITLATVSLIRIGYKTGPKPKWRWGKLPTDNPDEDY